MTLDSLLVGLSFRGCDPRRAGPAVWRADCPLCAEPEALGISYRYDAGLSLLPRCGCGRSEVLADLGIEEGEAW